MNALKAVQRVLGVAPPTNNPPTITSLTANPMSVQVGGQSTISVVASDPDSADIPLLTYTWAAACGVLSGTTGAGNKMWTAPATVPSSGRCTVSVTVTDPGGASAIRSVDITVTPATSTTFATNDRVQVATGDGSNLNVRSTPNGSVVGQQSNGTLGTVIGGPVFANGIWWWQVNFDTGTDGWVVENFLGLAPPEPEPDSGLIGVTAEGLVVRIDENTGISEIIGHSGFQALDSLTQDSSGTLFSATMAGLGGCFTSERSVYLVTIDRNTGVGNIVVPLTLSVRGVPALQGDVLALALSPNGVLYAVTDLSCLHTNDLFTIDITTGVGTSIRSSGSPSPPALDFSPAGVLYSWIRGLGLVTIDPGTGLHTAVSQSPVSADIRSIAFAPDGRLFGVGPDVLYRIDPSTGAIVVIGSLGGLDVRGLEFVNGSGLP